MDSGMIDATHGEATGPGRFRRALIAMGLRGEDPELVSPVPANAFEWIRVLFGITLIYDTWTTLSWEHKQAVAHTLGLPISSPTLHLLVAVMALVQLVVAMSIVFNRGVAILAWVGLLHTVYVWVVLEHGGDFGQQGTDPGDAFAYMVMFFFIIAADRHSRSPDPSKNEYFTLARLWFGFLWAYDAMMKFHPYFMTHFTDFLTSAETSVKGTWGAGLDQVFLNLTNIIGPHVVPVLVALTESLIALSLISGRGLRIMAPVGFVLAVVIWNTAESWGGPYPDFVTSAGGQMFGNVIIYAMAFLYILTLYNPLDLLRQRR
ncbi:hypothetical protein GCM10008024_27260 [Allgaiera indica]|uniref:DoxX family membrane protein n=2 Tax=Allgaiera indica TaxID=765699 RepID=A0AAN5A044_9RHOB|nr:hypothetical protein GCM10008024_27260 [Allgaiera indica]SDX43543.1 hypothetical protein SAMN05444006_11634 [Allgaiera indica]